MKYIKKYEDNNSKPYDKYNNFKSYDSNIFKTWKKDNIIGKYVIMKFYTNKEYDNFLRNNIGQIIDVPENGYIEIKYDNIPPELDYLENYWFIAKNIIKMSDNKDDLEQYITMNKYNL
jgi:hypothetical protein